MSETPLQWHPAFCAALQIELEGENLQFHFEYNLTQKPLQIDALVIQKDPFVRIKKSFGRMFRTHNIVEYKSPDDYLSINDYFKVLGYAAIYQANTEKILEIRPEDITITMVTNHYPRDMIKYLTKLYIKHGFSVNQMYPGIYYLYGLRFPTQILVTKELSSEETVWLSRLRPGLDTTKDGDVLISNYQGKDTIPTYAAFMDVVVRSNEHCFKKELLV